MKTQLRALIEQGLSALRAAGTLPADLVSPEFVIERPKERAHGDFSTNVAMLLAKAAKSNPRALAQQLLDALPARAEPSTGSESCVMRVLPTGRARPGRP